MSTKWIYFELDKKAKKSSEPDLLKSLISLPAIPLGLNLWATQSGLTTNQIEEMFRKLLNENDSFWIAEINPDTIVGKIAQKDLTLGGFDNYHSK